MMRFVRLGVAVALASAPQASVAQVDHVRAEGMTRAEALETVLGGSGIAVEFAYESLARAKVSVRLDGPPLEIAKQALSGTSYIIAYDGATGFPTSIRVTGAGTGTLYEASASFATQGARPLSVETVPDGTDITERRRLAALTLLNRKREDAQAVSKRLGELPPGRQIIRTQAVRLDPSQPKGQLGNIPIFVGIDLK